MQRSSPPAGLRSKEREANAGGRLGVLDPDAPTVALDDAPADGEAHAHAAVLALVGATREHLEHAPAAGGGHALAVVGDRERRAVGTGLRPHPDLRLLPARVL